MAALREQGEDNDETLTTAVEGETGLLEAVDAALAELGDLDTMVEALERHEERLAARRGRLNEKRYRIKGQLLAAIECAGVPTPIRRPVATVSVTKGRAKVLVTDEDMLPAWFTRSKTTIAPDLPRIAEALTAGEPVPGACMSNACPSLTIRTR